MSSQKLHMEIHNIKSISDLSIDFPLETGLYAITGENGSGKSTIVSCAATAFYNYASKTVSYLGRPDDTAYIKFKFEDQEKRIEMGSGLYREWRHTPEKLNISGFFEGSLMYGNRFRDANFGTIEKLDIVDKSELNIADEFVRKNLGIILTDNPNAYTELFILKKQRKEKYKLRGLPYFYQKGTTLISQARMSTGENLLVNILHSLKLRKDKANTDSNKPCIMFLDEIELALHPSALRRLVRFLKEFAKEYEMAIFFSTHSLELIREINPANIYFIERQHSDNSLSLINPCYPAYATRSLYCSFDYDRIILVEDDLTKKIVKHILKKYKLLSSKLVFIMPCGGWKNVIKLGHEIAESNILSGPAKIILIIDGDVETDVEKYCKEYNIVNNIPRNYLPIDSLEKYLKKYLIDCKNHELFRYLSDYLFQRRSLDQIISAYKIRIGDNLDNNGKELFNDLVDELKATRKNTEELVQLIIDFIIENENERIEKLHSFLEKQLT